MLKQELLGGVQWMSRAKQCLPLYNISQNLVSYHHAVARLVGKVSRGLITGELYSFTGLGLSIDSTASCFNLCIILQVKSAVSFCWLPPVQTSYLHGVLRGHLTLITLYHESFKPRFFYDAVTRND